MEGRIKVRKIKKVQSINEKSAKAEQIRKIIIGLEEFFIKAKSG